MREILFRGKRVDNGEWIEGLFVHMNADPEMWIPFTDEEMERFKGHIFEKIRGVWVKVNRETIGQFTGLLDKNSKKIFEGDIISCQVTKYDKPKIHVVEWWNDSCGFEPLSDSQENCGHCGGGWIPTWVEVIGNIHDNPELLEVKK